MHDRYLIYNMKNKKIKSVIPDRFGGYKIDGTIKSIKRDILNSRINLLIDKDLYVFREPTAIVQDGNNMVFIYGNWDRHISDEELLEKLKHFAHKGGYVDDALDSLEGEELTHIVFEVADK